MHIGSTVRGTLREGVTASEVIDAILPAGTLSGAPKLRACEIINELEGSKRGVYGGAIGYLAFNGNLDTCIAIRLAFKKGGRVFVRSGAGIVADSDPAREYRECRSKMAAVLAALEEEGAVSGLDVAVVDASGTEVPGMDVAGVDVAEADVAGVDAAEADVAGVDACEVDEAEAGVPEADVERFGVN
jgi:hypothetical protein